MKRVEEFEYNELVGDLLGVAENLLAYRSKYGESAHLKLNIDGLFPFYEMYYDPEEGYDDK